MRVIRINHVLLLVLAIVWIASRAYAVGTIIVVPPGLSPGETYRLVFTTSGTTNAISNVLANYNTFITNQADAVPALLALGATWMVIGSTDAESAATNIGTSQPGAIYNLLGQEVAASTAALFTATPLLDPIGITQYGTAPSPGPPNVWTGTDPYGGIGAGGLGDMNPASGMYSAYSMGYGEYLVGGGPYYQTLAFPLYGISSVLTVGGSVPEPSTIGLSALGGALLLFARRRR
jgi:hypothetical protein